MSLDARLATLQPENLKPEECTAVTVIGLGDSEQPENRDRASHGGGRPRTISTNVTESRMNLKTAVKPETKAKKTKHRSAAAS